MTSHRSVELKVKKEREEQGVGRASEKEDFLLVALSQYRPYRSRVLLRSQFGTLSCPKGVNLLSGIYNLRIIPSQIKIQRDFIRSMPCFSKSKSITFDIFIPSCGWPKGPHKSIPYVAKASQDDALIPYFKDALTKGDQFDHK